MIEIKACEGGLTESEQVVVDAGFHEHSAEHGAPDYSKTIFKWLGYDDEGKVVAALVADVCWDWMYVDELWVSSGLRGSGVGKRLMLQAEEYAMQEDLQGVWLWTQSWQASGFYEGLGYREFCRFPGFPAGFERIGFRKLLGS